MNEEMIYELCSFKGIDVDKDEIVMHSHEDNYSTTRSYNVVKFTDTNKFGIVYTVVFDDSEFEDCVCRVIENNLTFDEAQNIAHRKLDELAALMSLA